MNPVQGNTANITTAPYWAAAALSVTLVLAAIVAPAIGIGLYMTSGVWAALAVDLAERTFYRPIVSDAFRGTSDDCVLTRNIEHAFLQRRIVCMAFVQLETIGGTFFVDVFVDVSE